MEQIIDQKMPMFEPGTLAISMPKGSDFLVVEEHTHTISLFCTLV